MAVDQPKTNTTQKRDRKLAACEREQRSKRRRRDVACLRVGDDTGDESDGGKQKRRTLHAARSRPPQRATRGARNGAERRSAMRIAVTGGAGFIGSHLVDAFLAEGHDVLVVDNLWSHGGGRRENVPDTASFIHIDIRDESLAGIFEKFKPEIVCHHAAQHSVAIGARDPQFDANINVIGMLNVLEAAVKCGARKVTFASSAATYGDVDTMPVDENSPQRPVSPYGITKLITEHYLRFFKQDHGLDFTALR